MIFPHEVLPCYLACTGCPSVPCLGWALRHYGTTALRRSAASKCTETWQSCALHSCADEDSSVVECHPMSTGKYLRRFRRILMLPSSGQARKHRNLQNIKDKQVDQTAETRATHRLIRRGWTRIAVRRVWMPNDSCSVQIEWWFCGDFAVILRWFCGYLRWFCGDFLVITKACSYDYAYIIYITWSVVHFRYCCTAGHGRRRRRRRRRIGGGGGGGRRRRRRWGGGRRRSRASNGTIHRDRTWGEFCVCVCVW